MFFLLCECFRNAGGSPTASRHHQNWRSTVHVLERFTELIPIGLEVICKCYPILESCIPPGRASALLEPSRHHQPDIAFRYREGTCEFLSHLVEMDFLDMAITTLPSMDTVLAITPLWSDRIVVVVPVGHFLADRPSVRWTVLAGETFLIGTDNAGHELHTLLKRRMTQAGAHPIIHHHDIGSLRVIALVANGEGIALLPDAWLAFLPDAMKKQIVAVDIVDGDGRPHLDYGVISRRDRCSPVTRRILTALEDARRAL